MVDVTALFPGARNRRTTRVGIEHELVTRDVRTDAPVPVERLRAATSVAPLTFEPGGQVELNLPCGSASDVLRRLQASVHTLRTELGRTGIAADAVPVDPRTPARVPLQLTSPRYVAMERHFDTIGPAGRRMMRCTASTQVCLDWWPGRAGVEQWRVLLLAGPFLAAAHNHAFGPGSRLATWLAVDPSRTAFDDRLLRGEDPVAAYASFADGATRFTPEAEHLSTLFPPVRPRGRYLEVRFLDAQPEERVGEVVAALAGIVYDDDRRRRLLARLEPVAPRLDVLWRAAAEGALEERAVA